MSPSSGPRRPSITRAVVDAFKQDDRRRLLEPAKAELAAEQSKQKAQRSKPR